MPVTEIRGTQIKDTDITVSDIADGAITLAKMAVLPTMTLIGNDGGASATPQALTVSELSAMGIGGGTNSYITSENLSSQITGANTHYDTVGAIVTGSLRIFVNGSQQLATQISSIDGDGYGFTLSDTLETTDNLTVDYNESGTTISGGTYVLDLVMLEVFT